MRGERVDGPGFIERSGFERNDTLPAFFGAVGAATRRSVEAILPLELDEASAAALAGGSRHVQGIEVQRLSRALVEPVRTIVDRGGKAWRSYVALACCDAVGGDSQLWLDWLALSSRSANADLVADAVRMLEDCGAIEAARREASDLVEDGWASVSPVLADSQAKLLLRAFSWFVLERHY